MKDEHPLLFCLESAGKFGGLAFIKDDSLWELKFSSSRDFSGHLFCLFPKLIESLPFSFEDVDYFVVDIGPGSFTGLRVGLSFVKALCLVYEKPVITLESLAILAYGYATSDLPVLSLVDAHTGEVFIAKYRFVGQDLEPLILPRVVPVKDLQKLVDGKTIVVCEDREKLVPEVLELLGDRVLLPASPVELSAGLVGRYAQTKLTSGKVRLLSGDELLPLYLKPSQAERKVIKSHV